MTAGTTSGLRIGPYVLQGLLGAGAMGEVHRAADTAHGGRPVALKLLPPEVAQDAERRARFEHESRVVAALTEPHVVDVHSYGEIGGRLYLDMQLLDGPDLAAYLMAVGPLPPEHAVAVIEQVAAALDAAHAAGLVHHDVKPSNVLLHRPIPGQAPQVVLADFGIAGDPGGHGTVEYLAPERFAGRPGDRRVDVYALACVLHELLTGTRAFSGEFAAQLHGHVQLPPPRPSALRPGIPDAFDAVVARGMAKNPGARTGTAGELAAAARAALRPVRRGPGRRALLIGAAAGVVTLGGGLGIAVALRGGGRSTAPPERIVADHALGVRSTQYTPFTLGAVGDRPVAIVVVNDHALQAWDVLADRAIGPERPGGLNGIAYLAKGLAVADVDGRAVLCATGGGVAIGDKRMPVTFSDLDSGKELGRVQVMGAESLACPPGTAVCAVLDEEGGLTWIDLRTMVAGERTVVSSESTLLGTASAGSLDGAPCVVVSTGRQAIAYDATTHAKLAEWPGTLQDIAVLDGAPVAVTGYDGLNVIPVDAPPRTIDAPGGVYAVTAKLEGVLVAAVAFRSNEIALFDVAAGTRIASPLTGHEAKINELGIVTVSGRPLLVSAAADNTIRVWDLAVLVRS